MTLPRNRTRFNTYRPTTEEARLGALRGRPARSFRGDWAERELRIVYLIESEHESTSEPIDDILYLIDRDGYITAVDE